ncbi:hypothetical protein K469DRAFT_711514 [Zopfia rhizophila CBS 207.26]|uniref:Uncharacterized protein n=1 Tax=Zopfia rhizophila CBS 207.26 TaxID=1314779 RepID=A0A6A6DWS2_9PEZI|nr:hypothetical protein K469DRAFT_711514 [Zopfia rhizophila CBS 207.26]
MGHCVAGAALLPADAIFFFLLFHRCSAFRGLVEEEEHGRFGVGYGEMGEDGL